MNMAVFVRFSLERIPYTGNFRTVQNFMVFSDRAATAKIKATKMLMGGEIVTSSRTLV